LPCGGCAQKHFGSLPRISNGTERPHAATAHALAPELACGLLRGFPAKEGWRKEKKDKMEEAEPKTKA
jgi:hypothetical protein